jgi:2-amino-4-hydroxy-6-hydroxymethyldihydropteridine diphosphokinase
MGGDPETRIVRHAGRAGFEVKVPLINLSEIVIVSLGSNLGDSRVNVLRAIERLANLSASPLLKSSLWQTSPVDCPPGAPAFVNAVVGLKPHAGETPESLLLKLQALEREFGRVPKRIQNESRPLDLDLIAFGKQTRRTATLILPHPRAHQRRFVLQPLSEIAPELIFPGQQQSVKDLLWALPEDYGMTRLG